MNNISVSVKNPVSSDYFINKQNNINSQTNDTVNTDNQSFSVAKITASQIINQPKTKLIGNETQKFNTISEKINKSNKIKLSQLLSSGKLLDNKFSNDNSTILDNLYKIATTKRAEGLDTNVILNETINTLHNPFVITQKFGDIPSKFKKNILKNENQHNANLKTSNEYEKPLTDSDLDVKSNCCVAASIEFNIAHRMPAEFSRMVEQLTSEKMTNKKILDLKSVAGNYIDSMSLLKNFNTNPTYMQNNKIALELQPDRNAIVRARIQNSYKDPDERSLIDVLMQSTLMNIGSAKTYNSLTDSRKGQFDKGLANYEKTFAECLATGKNNVLVTYQKIDDDMNLLGYECSFDEMKKHITDSLNSGENVIIGYTYLEDDGKINPDGHEITIVGIEKGKDNKEYFVCKDTDNPKPEPVKYEVTEFLPKIHHAGIPKKILEGQVEFVEPWQELLNAYNNGQLKQNV